MKDSKLKSLMNEHPEIYERMKEHLYTKEPLFGAGSPFSELLQEMVNQILEGEVESFLEEEKARGNTNKRNGRGVKQVRSSSGPLMISTPRDRKGNFEPELIGKRERELSSGLDEQIIALYAQGNSVEDVRRLLARMYGVDISAGKISQITDKVLPQIQEWRNRQLQSFYPIIYLDAIHFKVRHEGVYESRAFYTVYAIDMEGQRDLLGIYIQSSEGASRWGMVLQDLKQRGVEDILIICSDDLKGLSQVITDTYPGVIVQKCIVHQLRNSLKLVDEKDRRKVIAALSQVYKAPTMEQAATALAAFEEEWGHKYHYITRQWEEKWEELMAFLNFPPAIRRMIYTTNPVEALHRVIRKMIKGKAAWVSDTALVKQVYLSLMHNEKSWKRQAYSWTVVKRDLLEQYGDRIQRALA